MLNHHPQSQPSYTYRLESTRPGTQLASKTYVSKFRLERGMWIAVNDSYLIVERVVPAKHGDNNDGLALCKPAVG